MWQRLINLFRSRPPVTRNPARQQQVDTATQGLALYHFNACPYCVRVRRAIKRLRLQIELRDAHHPTFQQELCLEGGLYQTPCLRIESEDHNTLWLYESSEIIRYLEQRFTGV